MAAGMNWLDYVLLIIIGVSIVHGLAHGALRMLTSFFSLVLGIYGAVLWHGNVAVLARSHFDISPFTSEIIGYVAIFLLIFAAIEIAGQRIIGFVQLVNMNWLDRLAGGILGPLLGMVFAGLNILLLTALLPPGYPLLQNSELAPEVISYDQKLEGYIPSEIRQAYEQKRDELTRYWNTRGNSPIAGSSR